jgi:hypothetical protein
MFQPNVSLAGSVAVTGPSCTEEFKAKLKAHFAAIMRELDELLGLCKTEFCDYENGFEVSCDASSTGRSKRQAGGAVFTVNINLGIDANRYIVVVVVVVA